MKSFATLINVIAFTTLFLAYASTHSAQQPAGVLRALQIYAGQPQIGIHPVSRPAWRVVVDPRDLA